MVGLASAEDWPVGVMASSTAALNLEGKGGSFDAEEFAVVESIAMLASWIAAEEPNGFGSLLLAITPWAIAEAEAEFPEDNDTLATVATIGVVVVIAGYNISVEEDDYSKSEVFRNNFLFYNLLLGGGYLLSKVSDDGGNSYGRSRGASSLGLQPTEDGVVLGLNYRF